MFVSHFRNRRKLESTAHHEEHEDTLPLPKKGKDCNRVDPRALLRRMAIACVSVAVFLGLPMLYLDHAPIDHYQRSLAKSGDRTILHRLYWRGVSTTLSPGIFAPVSCDDLEPAEGIDPFQFRERQLDKGSKFWISIPEEKALASKLDLILSDSYYRNTLLHDMAKVVKETPPGSRILDVGADMGFRTLLAASSGAVLVDSFEPNEQNLFGICESLKANEWKGEYQSQHNPYSIDAPKVNLYSFVVGKKEGSFRSLENNLATQGSTGSSKHKLSQTIALDEFAEERGWFDSQPNISVLSIGSEEPAYNVILGALDLIRSKMIRNIFLEVSAGTETDITSYKAALRLANLAGYKVRKVGARGGQYDHLPFDDKSDLAEQIMELVLQEPTKRLNIQLSL